MTKGKRKRKTEGERLEAEAFKRYAETGEVNGFGALADYLDERSERPEFAELLRGVMHAADPDVRFFYTHAGFCYKMSETAEQGRLRGAVALAKAEDWAKENEGSGRDGDIEFNWEEDEEYNPRDYDSPDMPEIGWGCILNKWSEKRGEWYPAASLWAITFAEDYPEKNDPYKRVVEAELALEVISLGG